MVALVATASLTLSVGYGVRILIDQGFAQQSLQELTNAIQFIVGVTLCIAIGTFFRFYLVSSVGERVSADIRNAWSSVNFILFRMFSNKTAVSFSGHTGEINRSLQELCKSIFGDW